MSSYVIAILVGGGVVAFGLVLWKKREQHPLSGEISAFVTVPPTLMVIAENLARQPQLRDYGPINSGDAFLVQFNRMQVDYRRYSFASGREEDIKIIQAPFDAKLRVMLKNDKLVAIVIDGIDMIGTLKQDKLD